MQDVIKSLSKSLGLELYLVGGAVRDFLLQKPVKDLDFTTPSLPNEVEEKIKQNGYKTYLIGKKFGTIAFIEKNISLNKIEITTFRTEGYTQNNRKPTVEFITDLKQDLARRDFTINSMAIGLNGKIIDSFEGQKDLDNKIVRATGDAEQRFSEDPLRMLRAVRFATQLNFEIEQNTFQSIQKNYFKLINISKERWVVEMDKILSSENVKYGLELLKKSRLINIILPEIINQFDYNQKSIYHDFNLWRHTCNVVENVPKTELDLRWTALLHDIAKPTTQTWNEVKKVNHFIGHDIVGADMAESICKRLKFSNKRTDFIVENIKNHLQPGSLLKKYDDGGKKLPADFVRKQVVVISGGDSYNNRAEFIAEYSKKELRLNNTSFWSSNLGKGLEPEFEVIKLNMPNTDNAHYAEWKIQFEKLIPVLTKPVILVGWSLGGIFLAKYLAENNVNITIEQLNLVAAPFSPVGDFILPEYLDLISDQINKIFIYHSTDDFVVDYKESEMYIDALSKSKTKHISFSNRNHFLQSEFVEILNNIKLSVFI